MLAADVSNYSSALTPAGLQGWQDAGIGLVIVQAIDPPAGYPVGVTRQQVQACLDAGFAVDAYIWVWFDLSVDDIQRKLALLDGLPIRRLWLDVEDSAAAKYDLATCELKVSMAKALCDSFPVTGSDKTGIYTGRWFWADPKFMGNTTAFDDCGLWDSDYDGIVDTEQSFVPYGGWTHRDIKQYQGTTSLAGISGIDMNVLSPDEEAKLSQPSEPASPTDPPAPVDQGWLDKKDDVVRLAGEQLSLADQLDAEANRPSGPRKTVVKNLSGQVRARANDILG